MKKIKLAFLGAGDISDRFMIMASALKDVESAAVFSRTLKNAKKKAAKYNIPRAYNNYNKMLKYEKPGAVIVTTPHPMHAEHSIAAMKAGADVLCEKPMETDFQKAKSMYEAAKKYKKILNPLPFDLYPQYLAALEYIKEKYIGKITSAHSELSFPGPPRKNWYYVKKTAKGGAMLDVGCYALSRLVSIMGPAKKVSGFSNLLIPKRKLPANKKVVTDVDDNNIMILEFPGGVFGTMKASWCHPYLENKTVIYGRHGSVHINFDAVDNIPLIVQTNRKIKAKKIKWRNLKNCYAPALPLFNNEKDIVGRFISAIKNNKQPVYSAAQGLHIMEILHKGYTASRTGRTQKISTGFKVWWRKEKNIMSFKNKFI